MSNGRERSTVIDVASPLILRRNGAPFDKNSFGVPAAAVTPIDECSSAGAIVLAGVKLHMRYVNLSRAEVRNATCGKAGAIIAILASLAIIGFSASINARFGWSTTLSPTVHAINLPTRSWTID
jgi:hypothetical protein